MALLYHWLGEALWWQHRYEERARLGEEGLALLGDDTESLGAALLNRTIAYGIGWATGDWEQAYSSAETNGRLRPAPALRGGVGICLRSHH